MGIPLLPLFCTHDKSLNFRLSYGEKNRMSISERRIGIHGGFLYPRKYHPGTFKFITKYCPAGHSGVTYSGIPDFAKIDHFPQKCLKIPIFHPIFRCLVFILYIRNLSNMGKS